MAMVNSQLLHLLHDAELKEKEEEKAHVVSGAFAPRS